MKIPKITDVACPNALEAIPDSKLQSAVRSLSQGQREEILASKDEIDRGLYIPNSALEKQVKRWFSIK